MAKKKYKKKLTRQEEFDILKLVLDKFLWLGFVIMALGFYMIDAIDDTTIIRGLSIMIAGAVILVLFMIILVKEYEFLK